MNHSELSSKQTGKKMSVGGTDNFVDLLLGVPLDATLADCYPNGDWFRVNLEAHRTYLFDGVPETGNLDLFLKYNSGESVPNSLIDSDESFENFSYDGHVQFTPRSSGYFFILAQDTPDPYHIQSTSDYVMTADVVTDFSADINTLGRLYRDYFVKSEIGNPIDQDWFRITIFPDQRQVFELRGAGTGDGTLDDPYLRLYDSTGQLVAENNNYGLLNRNARISYRPQNGGVFYVSASGVSGDTGSYLLATAVVDDFATGPATKGAIALNPPHLSVKKGDLEVASDIDWFKVTLNEGDWYRFSATGGGIYFPPHSLFLRDTNNDIVAGAYGSNFPDFRFQATETGVHHLVMRGANTGIYYISVLPDAPPVLKPREPGFTVKGSESITLAEIIGDTEFLADRYEVLSSVALQDFDLIFGPNSIHTFTPQQLSSIEVSPTDLGEHTIYFRARDLRQNQEPIITGWASTTVGRIKGNSALLDSGTEWTNENRLNADEITIGFPSTIPGYYTGGQVNGFQAVAGSFQDTLEDALEHVERIFPNLRFVGTDAADINIFMANISGSASNANAPGQDAGGDIVLNAGLFQNYEAFNGQDYLQFSLIRSLGTALGLRSFTGKLTLDQSVMGRNTGSTGEAYPSSFGVEDIFQLQNLYGMVDDNSTFGGPRFDTSDDPFFRTYYHSGQISSVSNSAASVRDAYIDIRPGHSSYLNDIDSPTQVIRLAYDTQVEFAVGGKGKDTLIGNAFNNRIQGMSHRDFLSGGLGNDHLQGGYGDDTYEFKTGWGTDRVRDLQSHEDYRNGGVDTLQLYANFSPGRLENDVSFRRIGNNLQIDLDLNDTYNRGNGRVLIENMAEPNAQIERMELYVGNTLKGTFSLLSAWEQSSNRKQRFIGTSESDAYGQLVAPFTG